MKNVLPNRLRQLAIKEYGIKNVYQVVRDDYWCKIHGIDAHLERSAIAGDEIWIGIYKDREILLASFFHELGHRAGHNCKNLKEHTYIPHSYTHCSKIKLEKCAWKRGLKIGKKLGYKFSKKVFDWIKNNLASYEKE